MSFLVISCSLNPMSRSRVLARAAQARLEALGLDSEFIDLQEVSLPFCDGGTNKVLPAVQDLARRITEADGIILAVPIYNFDVNSAAKNLIELTGNAWKEKVVGFVCAAGGTISFTAVMGMANSLMLDFRTVIVPQFVYATDTDIVEDQLVDPRIAERIDEVVATLVRFARALNGLPHDS